MPNHPSIKQRSLHGNVEAFAILMDLGFPRIPRIPSFLSFLIIPTTPTTPIVPIALIALIAPITPTTPRAWTWHTKKRKPLIGVSSFVAGMGLEPMTFGL